MANTGARAYYILLETLKNSLLQNSNVNTVSTGDISQIDLSKQTIFPLSHIIINSATNSGQVMTFNVTVLCMDKVNQLKTEQVNPFNNEAEHTVLNTQLAVSNVVSAAKANLKKNKKNSSGALYESIDYKITNAKSSNPKIDFYAEDYATFVDKGVQGFDPSAMPKGSLNRYNKAPSSPYKFGSGKSKGGSLRGDIELQFSDSIKKKIK